MPENGIDYEKDKNDLDPEIYPFLPIHSIPFSSLFPFPLYREKGEEGGQLVCYFKNNCLHFLLAFYENNKVNHHKELKIM